MDREREGGHRHPADVPRTPLLSWAPARAAVSGHLCPTPAPWSWPATATPTPGPLTGAFSDAGQLSTRGCSIVCTYLVLLRGLHEPSGTFLIHPGIGIQPCPSPWAPSVGCRTSCRAGLTLPHPPRPCDHPSPPLTEHATACLPWAVSLVTPSPGSVFPAALSPAPPSLGNCTQGCPSPPPQRQEAGAPSHVHHCLALHPGAGMSPSGAFGSPLLRRAGNGVSARRAGAPAHRAPEQDGGLQGHSQPPGVQRALPTQGQDSSVSPTPRPQRTRHVFLPGLEAPAGRLWGEWVGAGAQGPERQMSPISVLPQLA